MSSRKKDEKTIYSYADLEIKNSSVIIQRESIKVSANGFVGLISRSERNKKTIVSLTLIRITKNDEGFNIEIKTNKEPININTKTDNFDVKSMDIKKITDIPTSLKKHGISTMMLQKLTSVYKQKPELYLSTETDDNTRSKIQKLKIKK